jgi:carboxypeptidase Taq
MQTAAAWSELVERNRELDALDRAGAVLQWDQQTYMPPGGGPGRGHQLGVLSALRHQRWTEPRTGELLAALEAADDLDEVQAAAVWHLRRQYDRDVKLPVSLIQRQSRAQSAAFAAWMKAREADDYAVFEPALAEVLALTREAAAAQRVDEVSDYDVLLDSFDPGTTAASLTPMFDRLAGELGRFLEAVEGAPTPPDLEGPFPVAAQQALSDELMRRIGYDLGRGRLDEAQHPFTTSFGAGDVRITTHYYEHDLLMGLGGTIHEIGHALYEKGLPAELGGSTVDKAAGFGMHESQSRFWENFIGRSLPFSRMLAPLLERHFPGRSVDPEALYRANNRVERGLIRVAADEVTYNLHIIVRFRLEQALFSGDLSTADLRGAWDDAYAEVVGARPPSARDGVLQDVHWSGGAFGYFPSYTIGNLYAASLGARIQEEIPDLWAQVEAGEFGAVLGWLREKIHRRGRIKTAPEIFAEAVGDRDPVEDLVAHLWNRHGQIYQVTRPSV